MLCAHGVPREEVAVLVSRFGQYVPHNVVSPADYLGWCVELLPWSATARVIHDKLETSARRAGLDQDKRIDSVLAVLAAKAPWSPAVDDAVGDVLSALMSARGVHEITPDFIARPDLPDEYRIWGAAYSTMRAAYCVHVRRGYMEPALAALAWIISIDAQGGVRTTDALIVDLSHALVAFVGTWVRPALA